MSWIHLDDMVGLLLHGASDERVAGALNAVAPAPVTNRDFTRALAHQLGRPAIFPVPRAALRVAVGEFADFLLASSRVAPRVAEATGYRYRHPELAGALEAALGRAAEAAAEPRP
jgi:NAD dependent epimerase/dehydratase family enzyme